MCNIDYDLERVTTSKAELDVLFLLTEHAITAQQPQNKQPNDHTDDLQGNHVTTPSRPATAHEPSYRGFVPYRP